MVFSFVLLQDSLEEQCSSGSFTHVGKHDILATAIGKDKHLGYARGVRCGVGIRDYFGACHAIGTMTIEMVDQLFAAVKD